MTLNITRIGKHKLPKLHKAYGRQWVCCKNCGWTGYYDYLCYGLGNPILTLGCGHLWEHSRQYITPEQALVKLTSPRKKS